METIVARQWQRNYGTDQLLRELDLETPETGRDTLVKAHEYLRARGVHPDAATAKQLQEALAAVDDR